jgi:hypothetical protein
MAFSNNQQLLLWMGFFTDAQNDVLTDVILNAVKDPMAFSKKTIWCGGEILLEFRRHR